MRETILIDTYKYNGMIRSKLYISIVFTLLNNDLCKWLQHIPEKNLMCIIILELYLHLTVCETLHDLILHLEQH